MKMLVLLLEIAAPDGKTEFPRGVKAEYQTPNAMLMLDHWDKLGSQKGKSPGAKGPKVC